MSYAEMAAKGPKQSPEDARANPVAELEHTESEGTASLIDVDSPHVSSVKSDFEDQAIKTETQAKRLTHEAEDKAHVEAKKAAAAAESAKKKVVTKGKEAKETLRKEGIKLNENRDNPVVIGNAVIWGVGIVALGVAAYQKNKEGKLDWKIASTVGGCVAAFAVGDYFASQWLLDNKYPPK